MQKWTPTKENVKEGNMFFAEFLGYRYFPYQDGVSVQKDGDIPVIKEMWGWRKPTKGHIKQEGWYLCRTHNDLRYFNSWDWLYEVVNKAEKEYNINISIHTNYSSVNVKDRDQDSFIYLVSDYGSKRAATWNLLLDYIKLKKQYENGKDNDKESAN